jgi:hypothetical protein
MNYWRPAPGMTVDQELALITYDVETGIPAPHSRFRYAAKYTCRFCGRASPDITVEELIRRTTPVKQLVRHARTLREALQKQPYNFDPRIAFPRESRQIKESSIFASRMGVHPSIGGSIAGGAAGLAPRRIRST